MIARPRCDERNNPARWLFLAGYIAACVLFWWLPGILMRTVLHTEGDISGWSFWVSVSALACFVLGYVTRPPHRPRSPGGQALLPVCREFSYKAMLWIAPVAFLLAGRFALYRSTVAYGEGHGISLAYQAVLYVELFFGFMFFGSVADWRTDRRRLILTAVVLVLPRVMVSLHWGRYFLAQGVVPLLLIALARGWFRISSTRIVQLFVLVFLIVMVPAITRGDRVFSGGLNEDATIVHFFEQGSTLRFFDQYYEASFKGRCPLLWMSLTDKVIPYRWLNICTVQVGDRKGLPATLDNVLTRQTSNDLLRGSGSNYVLELYLTGGLGAVLIGSVLFGFTCRCFIEWIGYASIYSGIWAECAMRAFMAPRGALGYTYERIPSLLFATAVTSLICWMGLVLRRPESTNSSQAPVA